MKKLILLAIIGTNRVFYTDSCPLHTDNAVYNDYCRTLTQGHGIIISDSIFKRLSNVSPPYPCSKVFIISKESCELDATVKNTTVVSSVEELFSLPDDTDHNTFMIVDKNLYETMHQKYAEHIDTLLVITLDHVCHGTEVLEEPSSLEWRPLVAKKQIFKGFTVEHYHYDRVQF